MLLHTVQCTQIRLRLMHFQLLVRYLPSPDKTRCSTIYLLRFVATHFVGLFSPIFSDFDAVKCFSTSIITVGR